jgi:hypothetical protein
MSPPFDPKKIKLALTEVRTLVLGTEILIGFQFRAPFSERYDELAFHSRVLDSVSLFCVLLALALMIVPAIEHREVEGGRATRRIHRAITRYASAALLPFATGLALAMFVAVEAAAGLLAGSVFSAGVFGLALYFWYGEEFRARRYKGLKERAMAEQRAEEAQASLSNRIEEMLTESRLVLPGAQALLGFQLSVVLTHAFEKLSPAAKGTHLAAMACVALAVLFLMAPAAYHRIVFDGEESEEFIGIGSRFLIAATAALAFGLALDVYVVMVRIYDSETVAGVSSAIALVALLSLWLVLPFWLRTRVQLKSPE